MADLLAPARRPRTAPSVAGFSSQRAAQGSWARTPVRDRLRVLRRVRHLLAERGRTWASAAGRAGPHGAAETLAAEVLPLADALRYLERRAARVLRPRRMRWRRRPGSGHVEVRRAPRGLVLVVGPGNYPLFLPGVQAAQALAAGNAVLLKPAPGHEPAAEALSDLFRDASLPAGLLTVLPSSVQAARAAFDDGVDHVVLTGSAATGRAVLADLAPRLTPATMELSGCDAVFVRPDADLDLVVRALRFGLTFNGSRTCIAPRRVFARAEIVAPLVDGLRRALADARPVPVTPRIRTDLARLVEDACAGGARLALGTLPLPPETTPLVLTGVRASMEIARSDVFAPVLSVIAVEDDEDALRQASACRYALGATVFGRPREAGALAARVPAGVVVVNDMIAPTADPRVPFGGRGESGYGVTRGAEGLLEMTTPQTVIVRRGRTRPHLDPLRGGEERLFEAWLRAAHAPGWRKRLAGARDLIREGLRYARRRRDEETPRDEAHA